MLTPGLVSISFRSLTPKEIIGLVKKAGLESIEWGGDIHVPHGEIGRAEDVGRWTREAGLRVAAYGSYYRLAGGAKNPAPFDRVLASAVALGAPTIRVWAGTKGSAACSPQERREVIEDARRVAELATRAGITICLEYHPGTLTDERASARSLMDELPHPNIEFLWQPTCSEPVEASVDRLVDVLPRLRNVHVFQWTTTGERRPLIEGEAQWRVFIDIVRKTGRDAELLMEFVVNDSPAQFLADAATLRGWLK